MTTTTTVDELILKHGSHRAGACLLEGSYRSSVARRLASKLSPEGDCLVYTGGRTRDGYGIVSVHSRTRKAHRVAWELVHGAIPAGLLVCHRCDNPPCCYVDHLFLGTIGDNNRDREAKGRTKNLDLGRAVLMAKAAAVTHCPQGHEYSGDNVRLRPDGHRRCAECYRLMDRRYKAANRDVINERHRAARSALNQVTS